MIESDPLKILLAHDRWASFQMLDACEKLSDEQFHQHFEIGPGSLHDTLVHIVGAILTWTDTLAGIEPGPRLEKDGQRRSPAQLRALLEQACRQLSIQASRRPLDEVVTRRMRSGRIADFTRGAVLVHVTTHGMHHRAQCLNMLRRLGVESLPLSSVTEWTWSGAAQDKS